MREIKFRAWDKQQKKMVIPDIITNFNEKLNYGTLAYDESYCWNSAILMQYTGLKDKNGKEIYEGDILLSKYLERQMDEYVIRTCKVCFEDGYYKCVGLENKYWKPELISIISSLLESPSQKWTVEVIGNIYENPDLLEKVK